MSAEQIFGRSVEKLSHFCCNVCSKWWSIGDAPDHDWWWCPWCGTKLARNKALTDYLPDKAGRRDDEIGDYKLPR